MATTSVFDDHKGLTPKWLAGEAIPQNARVWEVGGELMLADAAEQHIGTAITGVADGASVPVRHRFAPSADYIADGAIATDVEVFAGADGKVSAAGTISIGISHSAAGADGEVIHVIHH